jgi:hypothetical protein
MLLGSLTVEGSRLFSGIRSSSLTPVSFRVGSNVAKEGRELAPGAPFTIGALDSIVIGGGESSFILCRL